MPLAWPISSGERPANRASNYEEWLARIIRTFGDRILPVDVETAYEVGALLDYSIAIGRHPGLADVAIAATAQLHGLVILTRNLRDFEPLGVPALDPFETLPS